MKNLGFKNAQQILDELERMSDFLQNLSSLVNNESAYSGFVKDINYISTQVIASKLYAIQRLRDRVFSPFVMSDNAWDMILFITANDISGNQTYVKDVAFISSFGSKTTNLRTVKRLFDANLVCRKKDRADRRRVLIWASDYLSERMDVFREEFAKVN